MGQMTVLKYAFDGFNGYQQQGPQKKELNLAEIKGSWDDKGVVPQLYYISSDYKTEYIGTGGKDRWSNLSPQSGKCWQAGRVSVQEYAVKTGLLLKEETTSKSRRRMSRFVRIQNYKKSLSNIMLPYE